MGIGYFQTLNTMQVDGPSLSNSSVATSILAAQAKETLPAQFLRYIGQSLHIRLSGRLSNIVTTPGTLTLDVRFGATVVFTSGAMQLSTTAHTTLPFWAEIELTTRAVGASANLFGQGRITSQALSLTAVADSTTTPATLLMPNTTPAVGSNFDSTSTNIVDVFATFSIANAGNLIQAHQYKLISENWGG